MWGREMEAQEDEGQAESWRQSRDRNEVCSVSDQGIQLLSAVGLERRI